MQFFQNLFTVLTTVAAMWALGCAVVSLIHVGRPMDDFYDFPWRSTLMGYGALMISAMTEAQRKLLFEEFEHLVPKSTFWLHALTSAQVLVMAALLTYIFLAVKECIQEVHHRRQSMLAEVPGLALAALAIVSLIHTGKIAAGVA